VTDEPAAEDQPEWQRAQEEREVARFSTWRGWAGPLDDAAVQPSARPTVDRALEACESFFGDDWLGGAVRRRQVPVMRPEIWPLSQPRAVAHLVELGTRIALVDPLGLLPGLREGLRRNDTPQAFLHLCVVLEVAGFALRAGWAVTMEERTESGRLPDITLRRRGTTYLVEVTRLDEARERRDVERYSWTVNQYRFGLLVRHPVDVWLKSHETLSDDIVENWFARATEAASETAGDGNIRTVYAGANELTVGPPGSAPDNLHDGPPLAYDAGSRIARRLADKAQQTRGDTPAWIRLDVDRAFFGLTSLSNESLAERLAILWSAVDSWLQDAGHVTGVILSDGVAVRGWPTQSVGQEQDTGAGLILPEHVVRGRQLARGPSAMVRGLPGDRHRQTFILPASNRPAQAVLGDELFPGAWYDDEPGWLDWALGRLEWPPLVFVPFRR
jgi:hypothetical protein